jgi:hypothetical protein
MEQAGGPEIPGGAEMSRRVVVLVVGLIQVVIGARMGSPQPARYFDSGAKLPSTLSSSGSVCSPPAKSP